MSDVESRFAEQWRLFGLEGSTLTPQYQFDPQRKWKADFLLSGAIPILVELEGWGRHQTYTGYRADCEKYNVATSRGFRVFRFMAGEVAKDPRAAVEELAEMVCRLYETKSLAIHWMSAMRRCKSLSDMASVTVTRTGRFRKQ